MDIKIKSQAHIKSPWIRFVLFLVIWFISTGVLYLLLVLPFYPDYFSSKRYDQARNNDYLYLILTQFAGLGGVLLSFSIMKQRVENNLAKEVYKFNLFQFVKGSFIGFLIIIACLLVYFIFSLSSLSFVSFSDLPISILFFLLVAITEEVFFRGYVLDTLLQSMKQQKAILWSSAIFSIFHIGNSHFGIIGFINIFLSGVLLAQLYRETKNLSMPAGLHFTWNLLQSILGFSVSGQKFNSVFLLASHSTNTFLTGGQFGMEGSVLLIPVILLFIQSVQKKNTSIIT